MDTTEKEIEMGANVIATKIKPPKEVKERIYTKIVKERGFIYVQRNQEDAFSEF